jgi:ABC-2 type transport system permease protein
MDRPSAAPESPAADATGVAGAPNGAMAAVVQFFAKSIAIAGMEVRKLRHDPMELLTRAIQPLLWLLVFGQVFGRLHALPTGDLTYTEFLAPGILAQSVLFVAIFYGISVIWERDLGIVHKFLVSPTPRTALVFGKALSAGIRAASQAVIVYVASVALGVRLNLTPQALVGVLFFIMVGAALFATFSLIIASMVKTRERFMGIGQVLTMPLFFASNAIYPISIMPDWLKWIVAINPLTYEVDGLRTLMLKTGESSLGLGTDALVLTGVLVLLIWIGARLYPRIVV